MKRENYYFEPSSYKIFIYYKGAEHPTTIERGGIAESLKWITEPDNANYLTDCSRWVIRDDKGIEVRNGVVRSKIEIVMNR